MSHNEENWSENLPKSFKLNKSKGKENLHLRGNAASGDWKVFMVKMQRAINSEEEKGWGGRKPLGTLKGQP